MIYYFIAKFNRNYALETHTIARCMIIKILSPEMLITRTLGGNLHANIDIDGTVFKDKSFLIDCVYIHKKIIIETF